MRRGPRLAKWLEEEDGLGSDLAGFEPLYARDSTLAVGDLSVGRRRVDSCGSVGEYAPGKRQHHSPWAKRTEKTEWDRSVDEVDASASSLLLSEVGSNDNTVKANDKTRVDLESISESFQRASAEWTRARDLHVHLVSTLHDFEKLGPAKDRSILIGKARSQAKSAFLELQTLCDQIEQFYAVSSQVGDENCDSQSENLLFKSMVRGDQDDDNGDGGGGGGNDDDDDDALYHELSQYEQLLNFTPTNTLRRPAMHTRKFLEKGFPKRSSIHQDARTESLRQSLRDIATNWT